MIIRNPNHIRPWQHNLAYSRIYNFSSKTLFKNEIKNVGHSWNFGPKNDSFIKVYNLEKINKKFKKYIKYLFKNQLL